MNLWDGYVRLFAAPTNQVEKSIPSVYQKAGKKPYKDVDY